jgi:uncharacterized protein (DUF1810 family)
LADALDRFKRAQDGAHAGFEAALGELTAGRKRGHWIWYIFPQLEGLGQSPTAVHYGVRGQEEAEAYVRDDVLRRRLLQLTAIVAGHLERRPPPPLAQVMGSAIDAQKLVSSMTLFHLVAQRLNQADPHAEIAALEARAADVLRAAAAQGYPACAFTQRVLHAVHKT